MGQGTGRARKIIGEVVLLAAFVEGVHLGVGAEVDDDVFTLPIN